MMIKRLFILCLLINSYLAANAQFKYNKLSATLSAGGARGYMDAGNADVNLNLGLSAEYHLSPFTYFSAGLNNGKFSKVKPDQYGRGFESNYTTATGIFNVSLGEFSHPNWKYTLGFLDNLYFGAGVGAVMSSMANFNEVAPDGKFAPTGGAKYSGTNFIIPVNLGVNVKFFNGYDSAAPFSLNVNYQHNLTFTDNIDGYVPKYDNNYSDAFGILTFGLRYSFGSQGDYSSYKR